MARLEAAVEVERRFATNAAHELRTPLAESLAQTQRLRSMGTDPGVSDRAVQIEAGLKKLIHLVERLLQFSRAQSGLGKLDKATDANQVIRLLFQEAQDRHAGQTRIETHMPEGTFMSSIDPDALAIILSNLIDNAVKHGVAAKPVVLDARHPGQVAISNDCGTLSAEDLAKIKSRFTRRTKAVKGYGIGLSIVEMLCAQSGARLDLASPLPQSKSGFRAVLRLP
jgi:two-component system OmpR family sensor kinase